MPVDRINETAANNTAQVETAAGTERNIRDNEAAAAREDRRAAQEAEAQNAREERVNNNEIDATA